MPSLRAITISTEQQWFDGCGVSWFVGIGVPDFINCGIGVDGVLKVGVAVFML